MFFKYSSYSDNHCKSENATASGTAAQLSQAVCGPCSASAGPEDWLAMGATRGQGRGPFPVHGGITEMKFFNEN